MFASERVLLCFESIMDSWWLSSGLSSAQIPSDHGLDLFDRGCYREQPYNILTGIPSETRSVLVSPTPNLRLKGVKATKVNYFRQARRHVRLVGMRSESQAAEHGPLISNRYTRLGDSLTCLSHQQIGV